MIQNLSNVALWMSLPPMLSQTFGSSFRWRITLKLLIQENTFSAQRQPANIRFQVNIWERGSSAGCLSHKLFHIDSQIWSVSQMKPDWLNGKIWNAIPDMMPYGAASSPHAWHQGNSPSGNIGCLEPKICRFRCPETPSDLEWIEYFWDEELKNDTAGIDQVQVKIPLWGEKTLLTHDSQVLEF